MESSAADKKNPWFFIFFFRIVINERLSHPVALFPILELALLEWENNQVYSPIIALILLEWENKQDLFSAYSTCLVGMGKQTRFILHS